jgi:ParB family transcriptional regulator, chromosome partitioning protein
VAKRQADYLAALLKEPASTSAEPATLPADPSPSPPPSPSPGGFAPTSLFARETALARVASGEVKQVTQLKLDPARVRIWSGNARDQRALDEPSCRDLIDSILAEGGQKVPVVVRRLTGDEAFDYELVVGTRRHWSISWLRAHNYPDMMLLAQVQSLDDEAAFRLADLENRARKDVSDFERARNYRQALKTYYDDRQNRMAERLHLSKGWLSKMMTVAAMPDWAAAAYPSHAEIQLKLCYPLAQRLVHLGQSDPKQLRKVRIEAEALAAEQTRRRKDAIPPLPPSEVTARLLRAASEHPPEPESLFSADSAHGRTAVTVQSWNRNGMTIRIHSGSGASEAEITAMVGEALAVLRRQGKVVAS